MPNYLKGCKCKNCPHRPDWPKLVFIVVNFFFTAWWIAYMIKSIFICHY